MLALATLSMAPGCNNNRNAEELKSRHDKLMSLHNDVNLAEKGFFSVLDSVNRLRNQDAGYHDSLHAAAISQLSISYTGFLQKVFDALGQTAAMANATESEEVDAFSVYLLTLRKIVEEDYSRMVQLSSLSLDTYGDQQFTEYSNLLEKARKEREAMENELKASVESGK